MTQNQVSGENQHQKDKQQAGSTKKRESQTPKQRQRRVPRPLRFACPPSITSIKHRLVLDAFTTLFEQFPRKIDELKLLKSSEQYRRGRTDILTDVSAFATPPPLSSIKEEHEKNSKKNGRLKEGEKGQKKEGKVTCNCNSQSDVFLTFDGYIKANSHLVNFVTKLEAYYDFYSNWWIQFNYAVQLMKPQLQDENQLESEVQEATMAALSVISSKMGSFIDSVDVCIDRFNATVKMQQNPHIEDFYIDFTTFERQTWFELCFIAQKLHFYYVLTFDLTVKNFSKLV